MNATEISHYPFRVPYGSTIGDRLWMWGHHAHSVSDGIYGIPGGEEVDMAEACRLMGIPGCAVVRWRNMPPASGIDSYMEQFKTMRRVAFSITDEAAGTFEEKVDIAFGLAERMPNLTTFFLDDFFVGGNGLMQPVDNLRALRKRMEPLGLGLAVVLYADQDGVRPEFKEHLDLCDEISYWFWNGRSVTDIEAQVSKLRAMIGDGKPVLLGQYMWDFGAKSPMPPEWMELQLGAAHRLLCAGAVQGLVFHCTPIVKRGLAAVEVSRRWIDAHQAQKLSCAHHSYSSPSREDDAAEASVSECQVCHIRSRAGCHGGAGEYRFVPWNAL